MQIESLSISIVGSGAVATFIGTSLYEKGWKIKQVWSRSLQHAETLAQKIQASGIHHFSDLKSADIFIVAVIDDAIVSVVSQIPKHLLSTTCIVHTSGVSSSDIFRDFTARWGLFYPLNTFSPKSMPRAEETPIYIQAACTEDKEKLDFIARTISNKVFQISDTQRIILHIAAVFASNFSNAMYSIAEEILKQHNLELSQLFPLIAQTSEKILLGMPPKTAQTGPAIRGDIHTIKEHLKHISEEEKKLIYTQITAFINPKILDENH